MRRCRSQAPRPVITLNLLWYKYDLVRHEDAVALVVAYQQRAQVETRRLRSC